MRRLLLSMGLALAVGGATLGAAASLSIAPTTLSAGSVVVTSCDTDGTTVAWDTQWVDGIGFVVKTVYLEDVDVACAGLLSFADLRRTDGTGLGMNYGAWGGANNFIYDFSWSGIRVEDVAMLQVAIY